MSLFHYRRLSSALILLAVLFYPVTTVFSQSPDAALERRVNVLEDYVTAFQPTLEDLANNLNQSIQQYTNDLQESLNAYSQRLQRDLDQRLEGINRKEIVLNPFSKDYQVIGTNTGTFLIAINKVETIEDGVRLHINIGNPNYADYQGFNLKFIWGPKRRGQTEGSYQEWQQSLQGVEYAFQGKIERGKWNSVVADLIPVQKGQLGYLEVEMSVSSVELNN